MIISRLFGKPARHAANMNSNEVISNRAIEMLGGTMARKNRCIRATIAIAASHPMILTTAMHIAAVEEIVHMLRACSNYTMR